MMHYFCISGWQVHGLEHELADGDDHTDDQERIDHDFEHVATSFFRTQQERVGRLVLACWFVDWISGIVLWSMPGGLWSPPVRARSIQLRLSPA
jgi:hypothetical protein